MESSQSYDYLHSLLGKNLRITTTDSRMFRGCFTCTDSDRNTILSQTYEYRIPPPPSKTNTTSSPSLSSHPQQTTITQDLTSRYLGLIVIPGEHITKIEVEEFASQVRRSEGRVDGGNMISSIER